MPANIEINLDRPGHGKVLVDGIELNGITRIGVSASCGSPNIVRLTFKCLKLSVKINEAEIIKSEEAKPCQE